MAYRYKSIERFINRVNKQAEQAANSVYKKYNAELLQLIKSQLKNNDILTVGMGSASLEIDGLTHHYGTEKTQFENVISQTQYTQIEASFDLPYTITKN